MSRYEHNDPELMVALEKELNRQLEVYIDAIRYIKKYGKSHSMVLLAKQSMKVIEKTLNYIAEREIEREKLRDKKMPLH